MINCGGGWRRASDREIGTIFAFRTGIGVAAEIRSPTVLHGIGQYIAAPSHHAGDDKKHLSGFSRKSGRFRGSSRKLA